MFILNSYNAIYIMFFCLGNLQISANQNILKITDEWNYLTINSLAIQLDKSSDELSKEKYRNKINAFKKTMNISNQKPRNVSLRSEFLHKVLITKKGNSDFYIIEANRSGERVSIINYLVSLNHKDSCEIRTYVYEKGNWIENLEIKIVKASLSSNLNSYITKFDLGFNDDDVIITQFTNRTPMLSVYYLFGTLSAKSNLQHIIK